MARLELTGLTLVEDLDEKPTVTVVLSRRNLLALLHKVDQEWSKKTLTNDYIYLEGELLDVDTVDFVIQAEPDADHYVQRSAPGRMHPESETFIATQMGIPREG